MKLSDYFTLQELTHSQTADRLGLDNTPGPEQLANLTKLARKLDEVRRLLGRPVFVSSGFRNTAVNKAVRGSKTSSHMGGLAADITCPGFGKTMDVFEKIRNSGIHYDQLIAEFPASPTGGWVHIGIGPADRRISHLRWQDIYEDSLMEPITVALALAEFVPNIVKWISGDKAGEVAEKVINIAKEVTGKETAEDSLTALRANPELALKYKEAVLAQEVRLQEIAADLDKTSLSEVNQTIRAEAASEHWIQFSWRPFIGFSFGCYINSLWLLPLFGKTPAILSPDAVITIGAILGVASWFRGKQKLSQ